jgi:hypothetical protein
MIGIIITNLRNRIMNKKKLGVIAKTILKTLVKIGVATAGATAFTNPVSATIAGTSAVSSAISAAVKDKKYKPLMRIVNIIACNIDKAKNSSQVNR